MAQEAERILGRRITAGVVNVPDYLKPKPNLKRIILWGASHPIPNRSGVRGVEEMLKLVNLPSEKDLVICLISGGASALMPLPAKEIDLQVKQKVTSLLLKSGANIREINAVRKHLSAVKGGRLAERLSPATVLSLIISDVVGDDIGSIASGPTAPDETTYQDAKLVLENYALWRKIPVSARTLIEKGTRGRLAETPKSNSDIFDKVHNVIIGSNKISCAAAASFLRKAGFRTLLLSTRIRGEARHVGSVVAAILADSQENQIPVRTPAAIVAGGETTVTVHGNGVGGRNQELVLSAALGISGLESVGIASIGTDGVDGPTNAAGAIADGNTVRRGLKLGLDANAFLQNNDSHNFFKKLNDLIITGPTGTNVNDIIIAVAGKNSRSLRK